VRVVGLGGSLRAESTSRTALGVALDGATASGADTELIWVRDLNLPLYTAEHAPPPAALGFAEAVYDCDGLIWVYSDLPRVGQRLVQERVGLADPAG